MITVITWALFINYIFAILMMLLMPIALMDKPKDEQFKKIKREMMLTLSLPFGFYWSMICTYIIGPIKYRNTK